MFKSSREDNMDCRKSLLWIEWTFKTEENNKKFANAFFGPQTQIRLTSSLDCIAVLQFERYQILFWQGCCNSQGTQFDDWKQKYWILYTDLQDSLCVNLCQLDHIAHSFHPNFIHPSLPILHQTLYDAVKDLSALSALSVFAL